MASEFKYKRRVQFAETDLAGIVHFSTMFRYLEEAEHAMWRTAGLTIAERGSTIGWPRLSAALEFRNPLRFEEEFEVWVRIAALKTRTLEYRVHDRSRPDGHRGRHDHLGVRAKAAGRDDEGDRDPRRGGREARRFRLVARPR